MSKIHRRTFLKTTGGMAAILATGKAPAFAQGTEVHWLRWNDFVPACDELLRKEILPAAEKALGIKVKYETVNGNDLQPRITSGIQSGAGPACAHRCNDPCDRCAKLRSLCARHARL